jgi:hypothetical protein
MGGMGFVPKSSWKRLGLSPCINCMRTLKKFKGFEFLDKFPKSTKIQSNWFKCENTNLFILKCDPSSQPNQLFADYARKSNLKIQNPKL